MLETIVYLVWRPGTTLLHTLTDEEMPPPPPLRLRHSKQQLLVSGDRSVSQIVVAVYYQYFPLPSFRCTYCTQSFDTQFKGIRKTLEV